MILLITNINSINEALRASSRAYALGVQSMQCEAFRTQH